MNHDTSIHVVLCSDSNVVAGLHVTALSILENCPDRKVCFHIFTDKESLPKLSGLSVTLDGTGRPYSLSLDTVETSQLAGFPQMRNSFAAYFRLLAMPVLDVPSIIYCDIDILCELDLSELADIDLGGKPVGMTPEAPIGECADAGVRETLGPTATNQQYFNSGVMVVDTEKWREMDLTNRALEYLRDGRADFWDQSALNVVLQNNIYPLAQKFNCLTNNRRHWRAMAAKPTHSGRILHFADYPKPWNRLAYLCHPFYSRWQRALARTAMAKQQGPASKGQKLPSGQQVRLYRKSLKDKMLWTLGVLPSLKGLPSAPKPDGQDEE